MLSKLKRWFAPAMSVEVHGDTNCQVYGINYHRLYDCLSRLPGAVFPRKPRYFWTGSGVYAEFVLSGHTFQIESDCFDDALWISPVDELPHPDESRDIRQHIEKFISELRR
jgi:hypothetical protein